MSEAGLSKDQAGVTRALRLVLAAAIIYACVDFGLDKVAFSQGWMIFWPLNGVTIAILLKRRTRDWAPILLGVAIGSGIGECLDGNSLGLELWLRPISVLEIFICAWLLPAFTKLEEWLSAPHVFLRFCAAILLGPGISGLLASIIFHWLQHQAFLPAFNSWATADALGIAAMLPLSLSIQSPEMRGLFSRYKLPKTLLLFLLVLVVSAAVFSITRFPLLFLLYPTLLIVESTLAFAGSAVALPCVCIVAVYLTMHARGPFGVWPSTIPVPRDVALQLFLGFNLLALFPASILLMERTRMAGKLKETNERLSILASVDGLTGIANRRSLDERFVSEWKRAIRVQTPLALLMIDLDFFKAYNDLYGHDAGDHCLRQVADTLSGYVRRPQDLPGRFGGEEFAILLPHTSLEDAFDLAERVRAAVFSLDLAHARSPQKRVTVSIGCAAIIPTTGDERLELLRAADAALYKAKEAGRNTVRKAENDPVPDDSISGVAMVLSKLEDVSVESLPPVC